MGEYIKYKASEVKIGTCEDLYYTSYLKYDKVLNDGHLSALEGNAPPEEYARPDSGFRFRFPFPDEDKLSFGEIGEFHYHRGVPVRIEPVSDYRQNEEWKVIAGSRLQLEITQQKLVHREGDGKLCLALVVRNPESGFSYRIADDPAIKKILKDILRNHVLKAANAEEGSFYRNIAFRIRDGFRLKVSAKNVKTQNETKFRRLPRRGKGLR